MKNRAAKIAALGLACLIAAQPAFAAESVAEDAMSAADAVESVAEAPEEAAPEVIEISSAEELAAISENLSGNYVLTADIDLEGADWTPLGSFVQLGQEGEEAETPDPAYAFTGSFDGNGYTISNYGINQPEGWCIGLFGCILDAKVGNFSVENASALGTTMVSDVIGYANNSVVYDISLEDGKVDVNATELSEEGMYGGIVGAAMMSRVIDCEASADITIPDNTANAGIIGGGFEATSVFNCTGEGTITAGDNCYGLGGVTGCGFGSEYFIGNEADGVTITAGDNCFWIGGITGYAGGYEDESFGVPVTLFACCSVSGVEIEAGANADGIGEIVGAGFYYPELADMGAPYDAPTVYEMVNCEAA